ncbi:cadherin-99C isoform X1 [Bactrocera neohumeralis]|uniref:cadherin-99C isoform X1 n=2 Tax=Bactrocera neohumeralis TaxID=98809 RepID=UPI0021660F44|nr:cadherin-99C isoform X1 [Bactrocera neohumeralis]XP_050317817.1 cadherin-99C isoform X1 [Bactrocera neohumeralis]XP_050317818.1 cadherin-99C isoform X1 [Bactrocera neohumeralis]XP_050317819.1 cadherin-99C isoform X1 [Bactrocera neohumeralis]
MSTPHTLSRSAAASTARLLLFLLLLSCQRIAGILGKSQLCEVETGQTNIILDIEESRGDFIGQQTTPPELPIYGDPYTEIALNLVFPKGNPTFLLDGKKLQLLQPLDRDEENLSHIVFQVSCSIRNATNKRRSIPIIVRVSDVNDNAPRFMNTPYEVTVPESTPVGTTIFRHIQALDKDAGVNGLVEYFIVEGNTNTTEDETMTIADGYGTFAISFPHQGQVTVAKTLDYEKVQRYYLTIVAADRARNVSERLSSTTTLTVNVADSDDQDPSFIYRGCVLLDGACINPEYSASVPAGSLQGVLTVTPERIQAVDLDTISSPIHYSFASGMPNNYADYFEIDEQTGVLKQIKAVDTSTAKKYDIVVKAEEVSMAKRFTTAKLTINVKPVDANPPVISASDIDGYVDENSPIGTRVVDANGRPISFKTTDADLGENDPKPDYIYELTTPSFNVTNDGILIVNEEGLDRDPPAPGRYKFQVVAREPRTNAASAPLSLTVHLRDVNDNPPKLAMVPPITITAGDGQRNVTKVIATDNDEGENAIITYSIYHVSNNGQQKFHIDEKTGEIETRGRLLAGEQYSITVQATDNGGLSSQAIVEIAVTPGPNTKPPKFVKPIYEVQVSEGAEINSTVTVVHAEDPENDPVVYSIVSGNDLRQFAVGQESGVIMVIRKLDRESLTRYQLTVLAEDNGGLSSSATVNIKVTDINDKNPEFDESTLPYVFEVDEGQKDAFVGIVHATDADEGINAEITYSVPQDIPFAIDGKSGEIRTAAPLDYERQKEYRFVVTAKDGAPDARLGTASVTVQVRDLPDEVPKFTDARIDVHVPENEADYLVATVQAFDPDTVQQITYVLRKGASDLFKVSPQTGEIRTTTGLDYEKKKQHELIVGTIENDGDGPGDTIRIFIEVDDRNDVRPVFAAVPEPVTVNDDQSIGTRIATMAAIDGDGSSPGNVVRYEMVGRGKALKYFQVDADSGTVRIRDDLRKEEDTEYQVDIRAYDMGEPQLSSVATLPVFVRHLLIDPNESNTMEGKLNDGAIMSPESIGLAFSDDSYTTGVPETTGINATIKVIQVINSKKSRDGTPSFKCEIINGNDMDYFDIMTEDHGCGVKLIKHLDFENTTAYSLSIRLISHKYFVNPQRSLATVKIIVQDENDNAPEFIFNRAHPTRKDTFYAVVAPEVDIDTPILQVRATDRDSGKYGMIRYKIYDEEDNVISDENLPTTYFVMTEDTGILRTAKLFQDGATFPMMFYVEARDNDGQELGSHHTRARIVINQITDQHRMSLAFSDSAPNEIRNHYSALEELLEEKTNGLITGIERFSNRKILTENGTIVENPAATDVWFYLIDPKTEQILPRNDTTVREALLEPTARAELNFAASGVAHATAEGIYAPIEMKQQVTRVKAAIAINDDVFPYTLIAISIIILILGTIGIIYICISWSKYKNFKQRMRQYAAPSPTRYDPVIVNSQAANSGDAVANMKEYETQVLAMAVPPDGDDDLQLDFSAKNHAFSLDNVSYITHKENGTSGGQASPSHSDATTATITTLRRNNNNNNLNNMAHNNSNNNNNNNMNGMNNRQNTFNRTLEMNARNNANPLAAAANGTLPGTLTLGRLKHQNGATHYQNGGYKLDAVSRNNLANLQNNSYSTMGRRGNTFGGPNGLNSLNGGAADGSGNVGELMTNTLGRNNHQHHHLNSRGYADVPITNPLFQRSNGDLSHISTTNENVTFGKRDYGQLGFSYLNDLDRSEVETTTEL